MGIKGGQEPDTWFHSFIHKDINKCKGKSNVNSWCWLRLTYVIHVHADGLSCHGVEAEEILCPFVQLERVAVKCSCLNVVLGSDAGHVPRSNLTVAEAQGWAALKHVTVDG